MQRGVAAEHHLVGVGSGGDRDQAGIAQRLLLHPGEADLDRRLAGNLNRWPVAWHPTENWFHTRVVHDGAETEARLHKIELPELRAAWEPLLHTTFAE